MLNCSSNRQTQDLIRVAATGMADSHSFQYLLHPKLYASGYICSRFMLASGDNAPCNWVFRLRDVDNHAIRVCPYKGQQYKLILNFWIQDKSQNVTTDVDTDFKLFIFAHFYEVLLLK